MPEIDALSTAYLLPFKVLYAIGPLFSCGGSIEVALKPNTIWEIKHPVINRILSVFTHLAATGALAGKKILPGRSGVGSTTVTTSVKFDNCFLDENALIVLAHLFLSAQDELSLGSIEIAQPGKVAMQRLDYEPFTLSSYPGVYENVPFRLEDEKPESGGYTFSAELAMPLKQENVGFLEESLSSWIEAVRAGAYGLAPIPSRESYAEPYEDHITFFDTTVEWTVFKVRADPACINGIVSIFTAFHDRYQRIISLRIS